MSKMSPERLDALKFQATHNGLTEARVEALKREGRAIGVEGAGIIVTPREMLELLRPYAEVVS